MNKNTYFLPKDIIPYRTPVANIKPHPKMLANPGCKSIGGIATLEKENYSFMTSANSIILLQLFLVF